MFMPNGHCEYLKCSAYSQRGRKQEKDWVNSEARRCVLFTALGGLLAEALGNLYQCPQRMLPMTTWRRESFAVLTPCSVLKCLQNRHLMVLLFIADVFNIIIFIVLKLSITWDPKPEIWNNGYQFGWELYSVGRMPREFLVCWEAFHWACSRRTIRECGLFKNKAVFWENILKASCPLMCLC